MKLTARIQSLTARIVSLSRYCWQGVWRDPSTSLKVRIIKIVNLCVRTFLDTDLQKKAAALVYSTLLAIVPAFALLFAIGRGFGLQNLLSNEILRFFPSQAKVIQASMGFVDSYLAQASQGIFVGVGIIFLLWTLISLLSDIESAFNALWGIKEGRTFYRKITDYTAICLLVPIMMVCSAGINIFMATAMNSVFGDTLFSPLVNVVLDCAPFFLCCIAFTISFLIIPNTHVRLKYAAISGLICGIAFQLLQTLFINGQIYVAKYNAIYGSFAFLPLLLIWLQLSWLILLFGCTLTFSMQNIFHFTYSEDSLNPAPAYMRKVTIVIATIIASRFVNRQAPMTLGQLSVNYGLPIRLLTRIIAGLHNAGIIYYVEAKGEEYAVAPAVDLSTFTLADLLAKVSIEGNIDFIPGFNERYGEAIAVTDKVADAEIEAASSILLKDIKIPPVSEPEK